MPQFDRTPDAAGPLVRSFAGNRFVVDGTPYQAVLLTPQRAQAWEAPASLDAVDEGSLAPLLALEPAPEFVLLGTGANTRFAPRALVAALEARGIGVEAMDSRAAARTWAVLRSEERWIAAALLPLV